MEVVTEKIGDGLEIIMEGLPQASITPAAQAKAALAIAQHGIPIGFDIGAGILGGISYATLKFGSQYYKFKYSIRVMRVMTAFEIYNEAIQWINFKKMSGAVDTQLADSAIDYLRYEFENQMYGR